MMPPSNIDDETTVAATGGASAPRGTGRLDALLDASGGMAAVYAVTRSMRAVSQNASIVTSAASSRPPRRRSVGRTLSGALVVTLLVGAPAAWAATEYARAQSSAHAMALESGQGRVRVVAAPAPMMAPMMTGAPSARKPSRTSSSNGASL